MAAPVYLGDEVTAAGFRLCGFDTPVPAPGAETALFLRACAAAPLVIVCAATAARIDAAALQARTAAVAPPVAIVPDLAQRAPMPDIAQRLARQLGLEA